MQNYLIKNISITNEGATFSSDLLIRNGRIEKIAKGISVPFSVIEINGEKLNLLPGCIDDQVHFREPGLTHKATIYLRIQGSRCRGNHVFYGNAKYPSTCIHIGPSGREIRHSKQKFAGELFVLYGHFER